MRLLLVLVAALATVTVAADTASVRLVFSGHGASTYNKWLYENAKEYPGLTPTYVQIDSSAKGDSWSYSIFVSFLDDRGVVTRRRKFVGTREPVPSGGIQAHVASDGAALFVSQWHSGPTTAYNRYGDSAFASAEGSVSGAGGLFCHTFYEDEGIFARDYIEVLDSRGKLLDTIGGLLEPWVRTHVWSRNKTHALYVPDTAGRVIVMDKRGKMLWQTRFSYQTDADIAISEDGMFVAAATWDSLTVRDMRAGRTFTRPLREGGHGEYIAPKVAISADNHYVAVTRTHPRLGDSVALEVFNVDGTAMLPMRDVSLEVVTAIGFLRGCIVLVGSVFETNRSGATEKTAAAPGSVLIGGTWERSRVVLVEFGGRTQTFTEIGRPETPVKLAGNAVAFCGRDSISVYRIETGAPEQRK